MKDRRFALNKGAISDYEQSEIQAITYVIKDGYAFFYGLKVSSRVMDEHAEKKKLPIGNLNFIKKSPIEVAQLRGTLENTDTVFFLIRSGAEKVYTGILESSGFKRSFTIGRRPEDGHWMKTDSEEFYREILKTYLINTYEHIKKGGYLDGHHGRYHKGLFITSKLLKDKQIFLIDIDKPDFNFKFDILNYREYPDQYHYSPVMHTNKFGYKMVADMINSNLKTEWGSFWNDLVQEEQAVYLMLKTKFKSITRVEFLKLFNKPLV